MDPWQGHLALPTGAGVSIRIDRLTWADVLSEVFDYRLRERAGALFVRGYPAGNPAILVGVEWMPVPEEFVRPSSHGLSFDGRFNLRVVERAAELGAGAVLVHAHPGQRPPRPSPTDAEHGAAFVTFMRRRLPRLVSGLLVVADRHLTGIVEGPEGAREITRLVSAGVPTREWVLETRPAPLDGGADRQMLAIGA